MEGQEKRPIITDRLVIPLAGVVGAFLVIAPGLFWASNLTARVDNQDQIIADLKGRLQRSEDTTSRDSTRLAVVETNYTTVLSSLTEIKISLRKLEERFNLK